MTAPGTVGEVGVVGVVGVAGGVGAASAPAGPAPASPLLLELHSGLYGAICTSTHNNHTIPHENPTLIHAQVYFPNHILKASYIKLYYLRQKIYFPRLNNV